ncbi:MAG: Ig domain-containing protein [Leptospira sp.]|nr:Ig domain-containing protein [Leptospira sp.]
MDSQIPKVNFLKKLLVAFLSAGLAISSFSCSLPSIVKNPLELFSFFRFLYPPSSTINSIKYVRSDMVFTINLDITEQIPEISGRITTCISTPELPKGLALDSTTCKISGKPSVLQTVTAYEILASNNFSSSKTTINITVNAAAPTNFSYTSSPFSFTVNMPISSVSPAVDGTISSCASNPGLPTGLSLSDDCIISGTPTVLQASTIYTITATNIYGSTSTTLSLAVVVAAPSSLSYAGGPFTFTINNAITTVSPTVTGTVTSYSVSPSLPIGLSINTSTGDLSGTPTVLSTTSSYTITAANAQGSTDFSLSITVNDSPPSALSYTGSPFTFTQNATITNLTPTVTGTPVSYAISPALPTGLSMSTTTGVISGTPTSTSALATYTITATNSGGNTNTTIDITVISNVPTGVVGGSGGVAKALVSWNNVTGATAYHIYYSLSSPVTIGGGGVTKIASVTSPYTHTGLTDGVPVYYIVTSENGLGESLASAEVSGTPGLPVECSSYTSFNGDDRTTANTGSTFCDQGVTNNLWIRFTGTNVRLLSTFIPPSSTCLTDAPGYMTSAHPSTVGTITAKTVCYNWSGNNCFFTNSVNVINCSGYYVYQLPDPTNCSLRYCTEP